ncbi:MAG: hypothetical protein PHO44_06170 [Sphaerochaetaceae bacterium]|nr:hypothetical protein [Sphaerochaetaceae bacterium]MDD3163684.1 hypothetical protein [Sphaerochaetaceae bacterium]MDD4007549.1 hypothetical protein [Sphaerochaetaceae bacterium]MDD4397086.1 hypothetical protein [Sphaerochaetaceae bacterium]
MPFSLPTFKQIDFTRKDFADAPDVLTAPAPKDGVAPENYHSTSMFPEFFKFGGSWHLAKDSRMDCTVVRRQDGELEVVEPRRLKAGDEVVLGRSDDCDDGIFLDDDPFEAPEDEFEDKFAFRQGRSRETAYSRDYDKLYEILRYEKDHGNIVWVMGPAVAFDKDSRSSMQSLIENGYVDGLLAGNALATHDLEAGFFRTALGQDIYTQRSQPNGHYNHLDVLNKVRSAGSIAAFIDQAGISDGIMYGCTKGNIPYVLAGSIRDDGPLPEVSANVYESQDRMRAVLRKATTVICVATQLHTIASGNMTPCFRVVDGVIRPVFIYCVDISEFVVNKLKDRGSLSSTSIVTNVQDFIVNVAKGVLS